MFALLKYPTPRFALVAFSLLFTSVTALAGEIFSETFEAQNYSGSRDRQYQVYVPDGLSTPAPMVMALHGCQQTQADVLNDWGLKDAADRHGFILVAPFITSYDGLRNTNCWGFWFDQHQQQGMGEPEDLYQIAQLVEQQFSIDPNRRYITGLSSGGAMTEVAAITHNEYWAAAASASGLPYGEDAASVSLSGQCPGFATFHAVSRVVADMRGELDDDYPIPLMVLQNNNDCTVVQPAGRNLRDAHLQVFGDAAHDTPAEAKVSEAACQPFFQEDYACRQVRYTGNDETRSLVETVFYDGPLSTPSPGDTDKGHYWIGGEAGNQGRWAIRQGPSYPDIIWDFFARHPRDGSSPPPPSSEAPRITLNGANPLMVPLDITYNDPGATAEDAQDGALEVSVDCTAVDTTKVGDYPCDYTATDSDGNTTTASRTVRVFEIPAASCGSVSDSPRGHIDAGRAVEGGFFGLRALAKTDQQDIGFAYDMWSQITLYEGEPATWYIKEPAICQLILTDSRESR